MPHPAHQSCANCLSFVPSEDRPEQGTCHRNAPSAPCGMIGVWPLINGVNWCREWAPEPVKQRTPATSDGEDRGEESTLMTAADKLMTILSRAINGGCIWENGEFLKEAEDALDNAHTLVDVVKRRRTRSAQKPT